MAQIERLEVEITDQQAAALKQLASRRHVTVAELLQEEIAHLIGPSESASAAERWQKALSALGKFKSGCRDLAVRHDDYLAADSEP